MALQLTNLLKRHPNRFFYCSKIFFSKTEALNANKIPEDLIPVNVYGQYIEKQKTKGKIYDKKPFKLHLQAGKKYAWCSCGHSKSQPICDGTHKIVELRIVNKPIFFEVEETKDYWLCNCKQTNHQPFCDGTHLNEEIQSAIRFSKF